MAKVQLTLSVRDDHVQHLGRVAKAAEAAGMVVEQRLGDLGVLTGSIDADKLERLHRIEGVQHVEQQRQVGVPPPGSRIQ